MLHTSQLCLISHMQLLTIPNVTHSDQSSTAIPKLSQMLYMKGCLNLIQQTYFWILHRFQPCLTAHTHYLLSHVIHSDQSAFHSWWCHRLLTLLNKYCSSNSLLQWKRHWTTPATHFPYIWSFSYIYLHGLRWYVDQAIHALADIYCSHFKVHVLETIS